MGLQAMQEGISVHRIAAGPGAEAGRERDAVKHISTVVDYIITCSRCGENQSIIDAGLVASSKREAEIMFRADGWKIGKEALCERCLGNMIEDKEETDKA